MGQTLAHTPLHGRHLALGARMGAFAGWEMPLQYTTPRAEHGAVRDRLGVFDVSHMGQIEVAGSGAAAALAAVLTNDIDRLAPGHGQYTLMCADDGGVIDDLIVYRLADRYLLVVNAGNIAACIERLEQRLPASVEWADRSRELAMVALQGRLWRRALTALVDRPAALEFPYFGVDELRVAGVDCLVARSGYTGEPGVEIMAPWERITAVWDALMALDDAPTPAGLVARDTLRIEMGYPLYGQELSRTRTPIDAGLAWACDLAGARFAGADTLRAQVENGTPERLVMLRLTEPGIPRPGCPVLDRDGTPVGTVTSGTLSPTLAEGVAMAYLPADLAAAGTALLVDIRGSHKTAVTAERPLVTTSPKES